MEVKQKKEIQAKILNLASGILMGKATEEQIETVTREARKAGEMSFLVAELKSISRVLLERP